MTLKELYDKLHEALAMDADLANMPVRLAFNDSDYGSISENIEKMEMTKNAVYLHSNHGVDVKNAERNLFIDGYFQDMS